MDATITFVLSSENKERIKKCARAENRSASNWLRIVIEAELRRREAAQQQQEKAGAQIETWQKTRQ